MASADQPVEPEITKPAKPNSELARIDAQSQVDFDLEFFGRVLRRAPHYIDVLRSQAELLSATGQHARALELDLRLGQLRPHDCIVQYNLACSLSVENRTQEALAALGRALSHGYDDLEYLEHDSDLDNLRNLPEYGRLLALHTKSRC